MRHVNNDSDLHEKASKSREIESHVNSLVTNNECHKGLQIESNFMFKDAADVRRELS